MVKDDKVILLMLKAVLAAGVSLCLILPVFTAAAGKNIPATQNSGADVIVQPQEPAQNTQNGIKAGDNDDCTQGQDSIVIDTKGRLNTSSHCKK